MRLHQLYSAAPGVVSGPLAALARGWRTVLDVLVLAGALVPILDGFRHRDAIPRLSAVIPADAGVDRPMPRLSVVVPARDEEAGVRVAVASMLRQDYPALELVLVDDRSTDRTGAIMAALAAARPDWVRVVTVESLPPGWLGKNHALWLGARHASGDLLLFADADMVFAPGLLRRAVAYLEDNELDHLTLAPAIIARGFWLALFVDFFVYGFATTQRLYRVNDPRSDVGVGFGAFNLVRRAAYERIGTHATLSLRPDDDVRLGRRIRRLGLRQRVLAAPDLLRVEWYPSLRAALRGLEKNSFAGLDYSLPKVAGSLASLWFLFVYPYLRVWRARGVRRALPLGAIGVHTAAFVYTNRQASRDAWRRAPALPLAAALFSYAVLRAVLLTLRRGGIRWRDTFYPLDELKSQTGFE